MCCLLCSVCLQVLTGPDESDLALSEVRSIVSSERALPFDAQDLCLHADCLRDAWTSFQHRCGFLPPNLQAAAYTLFGRLIRRKARRVMVGEDDDGVLPSHVNETDLSPCVSSLSHSSSCEMLSSHVVPLGADWNMTSASRPNEEMPAS